MNKFIKSLRMFFKAELVTFLAGILVSAFAELLFGKVIPWNVSLVAIVTIAFAALTTFVLVGIRRDIQASLVQSRLSVNVYHALRTLRGDFSLYDPVIDMIETAKDSIRVVGLYRPQSLAITPGRKKYYQVLGDLLETKRRSNERFLYERIIQVGQVKPGTLSSDQVDELTFKHCDQLVHLQHQRTGLSVHLRQLPDVLGALSFVVIDDRTVVFAIPAANPGEAKDPKALHLGTVIVFTDPEGLLTKEMLSLFNELCLSADPVYSIA